VGFVSLESTAIVLTAYQRPEYLAETLESWSWARGLNELADRRVCSEPSLVQGEVVSMALQCGWTDRGNLVRLGVLGNPVESVSAVFRERPDVDFVILAEEDVVVAADILEYFAWAQQFRDDQSVGAVCAHRPQSTTVEKLRIDAVARILGFSCPLVWGTWRDRWEGFMEPTWDRDYSNHGWDHNLTMLMKASGRHSLFPEQNRSDHIGKEGGAHCSPEFFPETVDPDFRADLPPCAYRIVEGPELCLDFWRTADNIRYKSHRGYEIMRKAWLGRQYRTRLR
jgi:hypothetical protein